MRTTYFMKGGVGLDLYDDERDSLKYVKQCTRCTHYHQNGMGAYTCGAFPDGKGIPADIWMGRVDHTEPYEGDHGIQFEDVHPVKKAVRKAGPPAPKPPTPKMPSPGGAPSAGPDAGKMHVYVTPKSPAPRGVKLYHGPKGGVYYLADDAGDPADEKGKGTGDKGNTGPERGTSGDAGTRGEGGGADQRGGASGRPSGSKADPLSHENLHPDEMARGDPEDHYDTIVKQFVRRPAGKGVQVMFSSADELHAVLQRTQYGLVSAGLNPSRPEERDQPPEFFKARHEHLRKALVGMGYCFTQVLGNYDGLEDSFLVMTHDADRDDVVRLGYMFDQESVIHVNKGKQEMIYTYDAVDKDDGSITPEGTVIPGEGYEEVELGATNFYTEVSLADGKKSRFSLNFDWDNAVAPEKQ